MPSLTGGVLVLSESDSDEPSQRKPTQTATKAANSKLTPPKPKASNGASSISDEDKLTELKAELDSIDAQLDKLQNVRIIVKQELDALSSKLRRQSTQRAPAGGAPSQAGPSTNNRANGQTIDYGTKRFEWSDGALKVAKRKWKIEKFRLCQEAAINAAMDGRDLVCVMPTGGGKSLIYQLPALLSPGTTVVVTPLLSLMDDQVYNLRAVGVAAEMINGTTSQEEGRAIMHRLAGTKPKNKVKAEEFDVSSHSDQEIKLVYVTPEKIDKSKTFISTLQKMYDAGLLSRIVIDEAHCVSQLGHDYRPAYLQLGKLKQLFPTVPILALTATAPQTVISDMIASLGMPKHISPGARAQPNSTVLFTSPLYRLNLRYSFVPKPASAPKHIEEMVAYINRQHAGEQGLIYCLSRADTEAVTKGINEASKGRIKAAIYHAYIEDDAKLRVHKQWREKRIQVVVATNASFGMGIDAPDVRYVLHHSLPKSISNHYQESGRAGRDGKNADCVTYVRSSDVSRLASMVYADPGGPDKLYEMVKFAEDLTSCRKLLFAKAFAVSHASAEVYDASDDKEQPCGHCDNCQRDPGTFHTLDYTQEAYRALKILEASERMRATLTLAQAVDLVRGFKGGTVNVQSRKGKEGKPTAKIDVVKEAGSKVSLSGDETETMLVRLLLEGYLELHFVATGYNTLVYFAPANKAARLTRLSIEQAEEGDFPFKLEIELRGAAGKKGRRSSGGASAKRKAEGSSAGSAKKQKVIELPSDDEEDEEPEFGFYDEEEDEDPGETWERFLVGNGEEVIELD